MIIGHLPSGYIASKLIINNLSFAGQKNKNVMLAGIIGSIAPDLDMIYFYLVDNRQHHHDTYWTHFPIVWFTLILISMIWFQIAKTTNSVLAQIFLSLGILHLLLDSIVGDVWWFAPFHDQSYALFTVPALYHSWWLNFILHWSFGFELIITVLAIWIWCNQKHITS